MRDVFSGHAARGLEMASQGAGASGHLELVSRVDRYLDCPDLAVIE